MKTATTIWTEGKRRWLVLARDPGRTSHLIDTNEYVMDAGGEAVITDPGGFEIFPAVFAALTGELDPARIAHVFASHQDPDVISSLALWLDFNPAIKCHVSWLWSGFVPHFGLYSVDDATYARTPTDGATTLGEIAQTRTVSSDQRAQYGGFGAMTPEPGPQPGAFCYATSP